METTSRSRGDGTRRSTTLSGNGHGLAGGRKAQAHFGQSKLLMLLRAVSVERDVLALLDFKIEMTEIRKWVGEGSRPFLTGAANADILREIIELTRRRVQAGAVTLLVKVKAHRGEPMNEEADDCADIGRRLDAETKAVSYTHLTLPTICSV